MSNDNEILRIVDAVGPILAGKVAIVNGASGGIGRAITKALLENGVLVAGTFNKNIGGIECFCKRYGEDKIIGLQIDVLADGYERRIEEIVRKTRNRWGHVDILINVCGVWHVRPFLYEEEKDIENVWRINFWGPYGFIKKTIPHMMQAGGNIISIASTGGVRGVGQQITYCASKAALINLTEGLAEEFAGRNIRVNAISPGPTNTAALDNHLDDTSRILLTKSIPLNRLCEPTDVAYAVIHFLTNSYLTGTNLVLNGG